ncbi:hypothetical protein PoB_003746000 [Plakobranchus ocellatus]|uniref:Uncharacterized protein n=1 Tax=Plakobranchus ocellatus TaxID=259542 RepID=A0AAV4AUH8_9GAST|nr:hypothetical protein PoB_003746000 [Plakobranchus ocellatus]
MKKKTSLIAPSVCFLFGNSGGWITHTAHSTHSTHTTLILTLADSMLTVEETFPATPTINLGNLELRKGNVEGTLLTVSCDANLGIKGDLRFVIFSKNRQKVNFFEPQNASSRYQTAYIQKQSSCLATGQGELKLNATKDLSGLILACISFRKEGAKMCAANDQFCKIYGTINVILLCSFPPYSNFSSLYSYVFPLYSYLYFPYSYFSILFSYFCSLYSYLYSQYSSSTFVYFYLYSPYSYFSSSYSSSSVYSYLLL